MNASKIPPMPACFNNWQQWAINFEETRYRSYNPCVYCCPEYQGKMIIENRCEHPGAKFRRVGDEIEGYLPRNDHWNHQIPLFVDSGT